MNIHQYNDALIYLKQLLEIYKNISLNLRRDGNVPGILNIIRNCLMEMQQYNDPLIRLKQSLEIKEKLSPSPRKDGEKAAILNSIFYCLEKFRDVDRKLQSHHVMH